MLEAITLYKGVSKLVLDTDSCNRDQSVDEDEDEDWTGRETIQYLVAIKASNFPPIRDGACHKIAAFREGMREKLQNFKFGWQCLRRMGVEGRKKKEKGTEDGLRCDIWSSVTNRTEFCLMIGLCNQLFPKSILMT